MTSTLPPSSSVRFIDAPIEHTSDEEGATQALVNSASRRAPGGSSYHSELSSASLSYQLSSSPPLHLYDTEESDHEDHGAPGSRRYRRYLNTIVSDYESETDVEEEADPHIVRFEWKSDFIAVGDAFFQGGMTEQHIPRISRSRRHHRLPTISQDGDVVLYGQEIAPYLYRRMDARVRPLLKKMPERDCHLITQLEHLIRAFKNDSWRWSHRAQVDAARQAQREADREAYHERLQNMTLSSSPDTDSIASSPESSSSSSMVMGTPPSHAPITSTSPPSPIHRPRFTVSDYLSKHRPTAFTLLSSAPSSHRDRRRTRHEARRRRKHVDSDDEDDGYVMIDKDDDSDDETICIVFQDAFQRFLGHGILHFHQLQSTSETIGRSSKQQRVTFITKPSFTSKSKPIYTHNASLLTHLQQLYAARLARQNVKQQRVTFITKPSFTSKSKPIYTHNASLLTHLQQLYAARLARQNVKQQPS